MAQPPLDPEVLVHPTFEVLYEVARSYLPEALRLLKVPPEDVDDLVHDIVLIAHGGLDRYQPFYDSPGEEAEPLRMLKAWLSGIAWRHVVKRRGRAQHRREVPTGDAAQLPAAPADDAPSSEQLAAEAQRRRILADLLQKLRPERAEALVMNAFLGMPSSDIAEALGINENTVKSRIRRARADAFALVKRLGADERSALEGSPLFIPFALTSWWPEAEPLAPRAPRVGGSALHAAPVAAAVLVVGMALGAGLVRHGGRAPEEPAIAAAREPTPAAARQDSPAIPVVPGAPATMGEPPPGRLPPAPSPSARDTLAREQALLEEARRALQAGAIELALSTLRAHEREFPHGALAGGRAWLQREAARRR